MRIDMTKLEISAFQVTYNEDVGVSYRRFMQPKLKID